jgi:hypothetical protein
MHKLRRLKTMKKVAIKKTKQKITSKALGMPIAAFITDVLCLRDRFSIVTLKKGRNSEFNTVDMCIGIISIIMLECERISHIDTSFSGEVILAKQLGLKRFFSSSTAYRFIRKFAGWHVSQLCRINSLLLREHGQSIQASKKVLDIDGSTHSLQSRKREKATPGYNRQHKGDDCYQQSAAFCNDELIIQNLDAGHVHCSQRLKYLFQEAVKILGEIHMIRLDSGYFSIDTILFLVDKGIMFAMRVTANCAGFSYAMALAESDRLHFKKVGKSKATYIAEIPKLRLFKDMDEEFRFLLVKEHKRIKKVKKGRIFYTYEWQYWGIVTSIPKAVMHSHKLLKFYRRRQTIENFFKETKQSFNSGKMPCQKFRGNEAYLWFVCIAYNISIWFKRDVLSKKHSRCMMKTIRQRLNTSALCEDSSDGICLIFHDDFPYIRTYVYMFQRINLLRKAA